MTDAQYFPQPHRSEIGTVAMAAWLNVPVDKVPLAFKSWTCPHTRAAWERVEAAIRADLPATRAQIAASPEVRALVDAAANAIVAMQEAKGVIVAKREWALVDGAIKDLRAALAAFKAMEAGG